VFIATILFYSITGASFNPFRWVVPLVYAGAGYGTWQQAVVYTLAPFIGGAIATLFFVIWVAINKSCLSASGSVEYTAIPNEPEQSRVSNGLPAGNRIY